MIDEIIRQIRLRLDQANRILITSHTRPDGDAIGSVLGLGLSLQEYGKQVQMALEDGVPAALKFLPGSEQIVNKPQGDFDLVIVLDCGSPDRVGNTLNGFTHIDVNIDHHPDNSNFAAINLVAPQAVSVTEILARALPELGLPVSPAVASNLLTGLITDTIGFKTNNMHPLVLRLAADLFEQGADLPELYHQAVVQKTFEAARYIGAGLSQLTRQNGLVWTALSLKDRQEARYPGRDDADLVNILSAIDGADVALIFIEQEDGTVKISWRTRSDEIDVSRVAHHFGGGGHRAASGAMVQGELAQVQSQVLTATREIVFGDQSVKVQD